MPVATIGWPLLAGPLAVCNDQEHGDEGLQSSNQISIALMTGQEPLLGTCRAASLGCKHVGLKVIVTSVQEA